MLTVIDMGISNLRSVVEAFRRVGEEIEVVTDIAAVERAETLVLPGVGAFRDGIASLREKGLVEPIRSHVLERGRPLVGICLGMQLLVDEGEEHGGESGLGLVPGRAVRLAPTDPSLRVPNMGWCEVTPAQENGLFGELGAAAFYFAHSYHVVPTDDADVAATLDYGGTVVAGLERGLVTGVQFHPEKSQGAGLTVLETFARRVGAAA